MEHFLQFSQLPSFAVLSKVVEHKLIISCTFQSFVSIFCGFKRILFLECGGHRIQIPRPDCQTCVIMLSRLVNFNTCALVNQQLIEFPVNECSSSSQHRFDLFYPWCELIFYNYRKTSPRENLIPIFELAREVEDQESGWFEVHLISAPWPSCRPRPHSRSSQHETVNRETQRGVMMQYRLSFNN